MSGDKKKKNEADAPKKLKKNKVSAESGTGQGEKPSASGKPAATEGKKAGRPKGEKKAPKEPKVKKITEPAVIDMPHKKKSWMLNLAYNPVTGTRFRAGTSQQLAFDITLAGVVAGKDVKAIRDDLAKTRRDAGAARDLDAGYFNLVTACHPEFFQVWNTGVVKLLASPTPDPEAAKKAAEETGARSKRATEARGAKVTKKPIKVASGKTAKPEGRVVAKK